MSEFKEGQLVVLLPRQKGWESTGPLYIRKMHLEERRGTVFTVEGVGNASGDLLIKSNSAPYDTFLVRPHWITPAIDVLDNV